MEGGQAEPRRREQRQRQQRRLRNGVAHSRDQRPSHQAPNALIAARPRSSRPGVDASEDRGSRNVAKPTVKRMSAGRAQSPYDFDIAIGLRHVAIRSDA